MWLLLNTDRKSYMGSTTAPLYLTLNDNERSSDIERSNAESLRF